MKNSSILIVEDEPIIALSLQDELKQLKYNVISIANSAEQAIQQAKKNQPDLILMDIVLNGKMDGIEAARQIHLSYPIPVIYLTAYSDEQVLERAKVTEPFGYLIKPVKHEDLKATVEMVLYKAKMEVKMKQLEKQLRQSQKMQAIGTLAGNIAHDFNNMLRVITSNISYALSQTNQDEELFEVLMDVQESTKQAQSLTHQLITFAKGGAPIKKTFSLDSLIKESASFVLRGENSICDFDFPEDLWKAIIDPNQFNQVIVNLVTNSNEAMVEDCKILIKAENISIDPDSHIPLPQGNYIKVMIQDNGIGIADKHLSKIFDPYFSTKQKGRGLGLAITYSIIKKHDGHITVESELSEGTIFSIYLPASEDHDQGKILIMDDQEPILKMLDRMLIQIGYKTTLATEGAQAIKLYHNAYQSKNPFDVVILALTVHEGMGGVQTISELLKIDPKVKAIISSSYSNDPIMSNYKEYGFYGVIPKPFSKDQMAEVLNKILEEKD
ncbi:MAG: hypothetical protein B6I31_03445 [Desulfobacteraceae bacterium 4572_19]|nr:MAG: hypothetical protein B6I31_03445 [Desulfobacteraceae bacterium 4572_19]